MKTALASAVFLVYTTNCCDMIAVKREVAALSSEAGFPWSECLETAQSVKQTDDKSLYKQNGLLELLRIQLVRVSRNDV